MTTATKPPLPPFDERSAIKKVRMAEDAWNRGPRDFASKYCKNR
jgi:nuclear transport factor 2 (NTF2) superfamily protein